jgi:preprotein translocase subunit SecF
MRKKMVVLDPQQQQQQQQQNENQNLNLNHNQQQQKQQQSVVEVMVVSSSSSSSSQEGGVCSVCVSHSVLRFGCIDLESGCVGSELGVVK